MEMALGRLAWAPATFWAATPHELWTAVEGWIAANCVKKNDEELTDEDVFTLQDMERRFGGTSKSMRKNGKSDPLPKWMKG